MHDPQAQTSSASPDSREPASAVSSSAPTVTSWQPPVCHEDLPSCGGRIGSELTDFRVEEIGLYALSGEGEHCWVRLEKQGITTPQLQQVIARAAGIPERDVGVAGMKDKHAVTTQWFSFLATRARASDTWVLPEGVKLLESTRHNNKLRTGHLAGNRFVIRLVEVTAPDNAAPIAARLVERGIPNYFGAQRFGRDGDNLEQALSWLRNPQKRAGRFQEKLFPSVIQSEVFNRIAGRREKSGWNRILVGDVVRLNGSTRHFIVEDAEREQARLDEGDIHLTGPIVGPKTLKARDVAGELENEVLSELGLSDADMERLGAHAPGTRRDLRLWLKDLKCQSVGQQELELEFTLDAGSYATQVVREFTRTPFGQDGRKPPAADSARVQAEGDKE